MYTQHQVYLLQQMEAEAFRSVRLARFQNEPVGYQPLGIVRAIREGVRSLRRRGATRRRTSGPARPEVTARSTEARAC